MQILSLGLNSGLQFQALGINCGLICKSRHTVKVTYKIIYNNQGLTLTRSFKTMKRLICWPKFYKQTLKSCLDSDSV